MLCSKALCALALVLIAQLSVAEIRILPTPDQGVQPRLVQAADGSVHLLYFKKRIDRPAIREGSLFYRQYMPETGRFSSAVRVSSQAFNIQTVSIARAAMAVDGAGRVHVMWYLPREGKYMYSRSNPERTAFEPQQSMVSDFIEGHDAGGDIAARGDEVALIWGAGDLAKEDERSMFARLSHDGGASFGEETMIGNPDLGACGCCSMAADYLSGSELAVAYRSAIDGTGRHMQILHVEGVNGELAGARYDSVHALQQWEASFCPLSTNDIALSAAKDAWLVFETESRIVKMNLSVPENITRVAEPLTETRQKNPAIGISETGEHVVVWGEAISHSRGGRLNLRWYDASGYG